MNTKRGYMNYGEAAKLLMHPEAEAAKWAQAKEVITKCDEKWNKFLTISQNPQHPRHATAMLAKKFYERLVKVGGNTTISLAIFFGAMVCDSANALEMLSECGVIVSLGQGRWEVTQ